MNYNHVTRNADTPQDLKLIGWIALQDQTLSADQLHTIAKDLRERLEILQNKTNK